MPCVNHFWRAFLIVLLLGVLPARAEVKPNIIFILADDMGYGDIEPFGSQKNRTPNLVRMAREGMKLTSFYAAPLCTPSRAQILTGCYAKRVSLPDVIFPRSHVGLNTNEHTIASLLKQQGYATMAIGKWHVGDDAQYLPTRHGFDHYLGLPYSNDMGGESPGHERNNDNKLIPPLPLVRDETVIETLRPQDQDKLTALYADEAVKFIHAHTNGPFFLYLPHNAVHIPLHPGAKFRGKSANGLYGDWVEEVDWCVGQVLDAVRETGMQDRTLVIFSSDNGPWLAKGTNAGNAGPLRSGKGSTFEGGLREPALAWWPGKIQAGTVSTTMAAEIDLLPTFVKLAGGIVPTDHKIDGVDIAPLLLGRTKETPHDAFYYFASTSLQAVRVGPWKLALVPQYDGHGAYKAVPPDLTKPTTLRLYNLETDIGEQHDVVSAHPEVVHELLAKAREMDADLGAGKTNGPGVRQPGHIADPIGMWLPGHQPKAEAGFDAGKTLRIGDELSGESAPQIGGKTFRITGRVQTSEKNGVIVAQGGSKSGYSIYLIDGLVNFVVRENGKLFSTVTKAAVGDSFAFDASLSTGGAMSLQINGEFVVTGQAPGLIAKQPQESFCVGLDNGAPVAHYTWAGTEKLKGEILDLKIVVGGK